MQNAFIIAVSIPPLCRYAILCWESTHTPDGCGKTERQAQCDRNCITSAIIILWLAGDQSRRRIEKWWTMMESTINCIWFILNIDEFIACSRARMGNMNCWMVATWSYCHRRCWRERVISSAGLGMHDSEASSIYLSLYPALLHSRSNGTVELWMEEKIIIIKRRLSSNSCRQTFDYVRFYHKLLPHNLFITTCTVLGVPFSLFTYSGPGHSCKTKWWKAIPVCSSRSSFIGTMAVICIVDTSFHIRNTSYRIFYRLYSIHINRNNLILSVMFQLASMHHHATLSICHLCRSRLRVGWFSDEFLPPDNARTAGTSDRLLILFEMRDNSAMW